MTSSVIYVIVDQYGCYYQRPSYKPGTGTANNRGTGSGRGKIMAYTEKHLAERQANRVNRNRSPNTDTLATRAYVAEILMAPEDIQS